MQCYENWTAWQEEQDILNDALRYILATLMDKV